MVRRVRAAAAVGCSDCVPARVHAPQGTDQLLLLRRVDALHQRGLALRLRHLEQGVCVEGVPRHHRPDDGRGLGKRHADGALSGLQELVRADEPKRDGDRTEAQVPRPQESRLAPPPRRLHPPPRVLARERQVNVHALGSGQLGEQQLLPKLLDVGVPQVAPANVLQRPTEQVGHRAVDRSLISVKKC